MAKSYRLRCGAIEAEVGPREVYAGRGGGCALLLDDALVSRRHARFFLADGKLWVRDLQSRNGVLVNGQRIAADTDAALGVDTVVTVGSFEIRVEALEPAAAGRARAQHPTMPMAAVTDAQIAQFDGTPTSLDVGWSIIDLALEAGNIAEARKRIMEKLLGALQAAAQKKITAAGLVQPSKYALRLATETGEASWVDWVFDAYQTSGFVIPALLVDELHGVARKVRYRVTSRTRAYVDGLAARAEQLTPSERFAVQRLQGLLRTLRAV